MPARSPDAPAASARPLPRGPHRLSRAQVERSQRDRLMAAMAEAVAERGYANTAVADVLAGAGVSRATFYRLFRDKEDCFSATYRAGLEIIAATMAAALAETEPDARRGPALDPLARLDHVLTTYLDALLAAPALARTFLLEVYAAGPEASELRRQSLDRIVDIVAETHRGATGLLGTDPGQRFAAEALVAAVSSMVTNLLGVGDLDGIRDLHDPIMRLAGAMSGAGAAAT